MLENILMNLLLIVTFPILLSGCTPLVSAARTGNDQEVAQLLNGGADIRQTDCIVIRTGTCIRYTAVFAAAEKGHLSTIKLLLDRGANVNEGHDGWSALMIAADNGHTEIVKYLLARGADPSVFAVNEINTKTALMLAQEKGHSDIVQILKKAEENKRPAKKDQKQQVQSIVATNTPNLISDLDELPSQRAKFNTKAFAIVIGVENYRQKLPKADFATQDAKLVADYLTKVMGYPEENVVTLMNDRATNVDLVKYFEKWLPNNVEPGSTVFVYYSGHGAPNPKTSDAYLVPYDGDPSFIDETGYSLKRMYAALGKLPAKEVIVALDSCFSGAGGRSVIAKGSRPLVMNLQNNVSIPKNMTVLSASSGDQTSSTYDEKGHGLFTYFLLKGIKNEDVVKQDGSLKIDDLYGYLKPQVERIARKQYNNEQTPQMIEPK